MGEVGQTHTAGASSMSGQRTDKPRVLVVRSDALRDRVGAAIAGARLDAQVDASPSYLSAMGWLTHQRADVIIGPVSAMTGMVSSTAKALRRLAPGTRLVAVATGSERAEADAASAAGFDQCVTEPVDATTLLAAMRLFDAEKQAPHESPPIQSPHDAYDQPEQHHESIDPTHPARTDDRADASFAATNEQATTAVAAGEQDWLRHAFDQTSPVLPTDDIGDVDLAEAVMRDDGSLLPLAMRLLRNQSGLADAEFVPIGSADDSPPGVVDVAYAGRIYGGLASPSADARSLGSWSAWLARWVALDRRQSELYTLAMRDELTGLWNRRYFDRFLERVIDHAAEGRQQATLLVFDIDNFKTYNDHYGHPAGDEILRSTAKLIQSLVREHDVVARIGGDEFAVVFWDKGEPRHLGSQHPDSVIGIAKRFQKAICEHRFPALGEDAVGNLTVSGGLAGFPWDGRTPEELLARADAMALQSKRQGKNAICFGPGAAPNGSGEH